MKALPPGTILQLMYLSERLERLQPGRFIEIGAGNGEITSLLLSRGWIGSVYEFDADTTARLKERFADEIVEGRLVLSNSNYVRSETADVDIVISSMVMEHLSDEDEALFMQKSRAIWSTSTEPLSGSFRPALVIGGLRTRLQAISADIHRIGSKLSHGRAAGRYSTSKA
ncbi:class I SAM-dependent methyltransferase [Rhizobium leguminosarum]|nr:class I SAM-dependent methyltransferase [Rhizobium leguminosarum]